MKNKSSLILLRCLLLLLICLQLYLIFDFSAQDAEVSGDTSQEVAEQIAKVVVKDYEKLSEEEQAAAVARIDPPIRKIAHATEFGLLGGLVLLFLFTFPIPKWIPLPSSVLVCAMFGALDEWHQTFVPGRSGRIRDVLIDSAGALLVSTLLFLILLSIQKNGQKIIVTKKVLAAPVSAKIAIVADLHGNPGEPILALLQKETPDFILVPGDLTDRENLEDENDPAFSFLREAAMLAPVYYSLGNHEIGCYRKGFRKNRTPIPLSDVARNNLAKTGVFLLENRFFVQGGLSICGLTSNGGGSENAPWSEGLAKRFSQSPGYKILLCHHPEQFDAFIQMLPNVDLTISGHAHGGQWRLFGKSIYAPDQGLFPTYTGGFYHEGRLLVSRGLGDSTLIPRISNPRELLILELTPCNTKTSENA